MMLKPGDRLVRVRNHLWDIWETNLLKKGLSPTASYVIAEVNNQSHHVTFHGMVSVHWRTENFKLVPDKEVKDLKEYM